MFQHRDGVIHPVLHADADGIGGFQPSKGLCLLNGFQMLGGGDIPRSLLLTGQPAKGLHSKKCRPSFA
ncbi:MAG TPA: hypothetical protein DD738_02515 [Ruminiclostridium sp.]|nr:hypothetical protein [Ruminiclostridium sp.]